MTFEHITAFFMAYTAMVVVGSLSLIYSAVSTLSGYTKLRNGILRYMSHRLMSQGMWVRGTLARVNEKQYRMADPLKDQSVASWEVLVRVGGARQDLTRIHRRVLHGFNERALPLLERPITSTRDAQRLQKQLHRIAFWESAKILSDHRVQRYVVAYFVRLLDVLGRSGAAGFVLSSFAVVWWNAFTRSFDPYSGFSFLVSFVLASVFGTYFVGQHYVRRRLLNTVLFVVLCSLPAAVLTYMMFWGGAS